MSGVLKTGEYVTIQLALPGRPAVTVGVILLDLVTDRLHARWRSDWESLAPPEDVEVLRLVPAHIEKQARESGGEAVLAYLLDTLSNILQISDRIPIQFTAVNEALARIFSEHCAPRNQRVP